MRQWKKALTILRDYYLSKGKLKVISLYTELTSLRKLESESITDYIIRAENISNTVKEAGKVISDRLVIVMVLKGLPLNFKPFTMVIIQKRKIFFWICSMFKLWKKWSVCVTPPPDESNNVLQMKTTFKKINPRNKLWVNTHSHYDYKSTNYNNYQKP